MPLSKEQRVRYVGVYGRAYVAERDTDMGDAMAAITAVAEAARKDLYAELLAAAKADGWVYLTNGYARPDDEEELFTSWLTAQEEAE